MPIPPPKNLNRVVTGSSGSAAPRQTAGEFREMPRPTGSVRRRRRQSHRSGRSSTGNIFFQRLIILGLSLGGLALVALLAYGLLSPSTPATTTAGPLSADAATIDLIPRPAAAAAIGLATRMLNAKSADEIAALIHAGRITPTQALEFIASLPNRHLEPIWLGSMDSDVAPIEGMFLPDRGGPTRLVLLTPDEAGTWKIDFDAFARHAETPVEDLVEGRIDAAVHRLLVIRDFYYNSLYINESEWECFALKSPDSPLIFYGYCRRDSVQSQAIQRIQKQPPISSESAGDLSSGTGKRSFRATLRLERETGADSRQFRIASVIADDWIIGEQPLDESEIFHAAPWSPPTSE